MGKRSNFERVERDFYFTMYCIPEQKQITFYQFFNERDRLRFYHALGKGMYAINLRKEGVTFKDIATYLGVSRARAFQIVRKYERYERKKWVGYRENRDVYAEFKHHYDEAMNDPEGD